MACMTQSHGFHAPPDAPAHFQPKHPVATKILGAENRPYKHKDLTFGFQGPVLGRIPETIASRCLCLRGLLGP